MRAKADLSNSQNKQKEMGYFHIVSIFRKNNTAEINYQQISGTQTLIAQEFERRKNKSYKNYGNYLKY